ncbi:MAG: hypothetical protein WDW36_000060 [Sanguina aurantia]
MHGMEAGAIMLVVRLHDGRGPARGRLGWVPSAAAVARGAGECLDADSSAGGFACTAGDAVVWVDAAARCTSSGRAASATAAGLAVAAAGLGGMAAGLAGRAAGTASWTSPLTPTTIIGAVEVVGGDQDDLHDERGPVPSVVGDGPPLETSGLRGWGPIVGGELAAVAASASGAPEASWVERGQGCLLTEWCERTVDPRLQQELAHAV